MQPIILFFLAMGLFVSWLWQIAATHAKDATDLSLPPDLRRFAIGKCSEMKAYTWIIAILLLLCSYSWMVNV